ncbi:MAG: fused MFS/spermidine synthase [Gammaproteobacteria bacterium]|jgi:spermidine synthase|nr:fused MFS/spermidine synthase [Gammaproteobacteria bacterium]MDP6732442.1 fused MFS/spermidine synthase [Gammaproteobacteria bacterium]
MQRNRPNRNIALNWLPALLIVLLGLPVAAETIHEERSKYRDITVTQVRDRRCLLFNVHRGDRNQTCISMDDRDRLVFDYTRMTFAGLLLKPDPQRILIIGLGGGTLPLTFTDLLPDATIDVVEIDEAVVNVAEEFFFFSETDNMKVTVDDGRPFIKRAGIRGESYDFIVLDAFSGDYIPEHMLTREFLEEVKRIMSPDGVLVANTFSTSRLYDHESVTYQRVFNEFFNFKLPTSGNRMIITQLDPLPPRGRLVTEAQKIAERLEKYGVPLLEYPRRLSTRVDWDMSRRILTDQYSPGNLLKDN